MFLDWPAIPNHPPLAETVAMLSIILWKTKPAWYQKNQVKELHCNTFN